MTRRSDPDQRMGTWVIVFAFLMLALAAHTCATSPHLQ